MRVIYFMGEKGLCLTDIDDVYLDREEGRVRLLFGPSTIYLDVSVPIAKEAIRVGAMNGWVDLCQAQRQAQRDAEVDNDERRT